jgi:hypothetical protein
MLISFLLRPYNLTNELNMTPVRWSLIFTISRGLRLLYDVRLLAKPKQPEEYAKELWKTMLTVIDDFSCSFKISLFISRK